MLENKKDIVESNVIYKKKINFKNENYKKNGLLFFSFICGVVTLIGFLLFILFSNTSKVFDVVVSGNRYLDDEDIVHLAQIDDNYYLNIPFIIEPRIKKHPLIDYVKVSYLDGNIISIEVVEKKMIGYRLNEDSQFEAVLDSGDSFIIEENETYLISNVPLFETIKADKYEKFCKKIGELDDNIIKQISEITSYPFSYDPDMYEFVMADGNYCFVSLIDIEKIVEYYSISFNIDQDVGHACIYIGDFTISAYASTCPWQEQ